jgi:hypothetical protein
MKERKTEGGDRKIEGNKPKELYRTFFWRADYKCELKYKILVNATL